MTYSFSQCGCATIPIELPYFHISPLWHSTIFYSNFMRSLLRPAFPPQLFWRYYVLYRLIFCYMSLLKASVGLSEWFRSLLGTSRYCHLESLQVIHSFETDSQSIALRGRWTTDFYFEIVILQWLFLLFPTSKPSLILIFMCTYSLLTLSFYNIFLFFRDITSHIPILFDSQSTPEKSPICVINILTWAQ